MIVDRDRDFTASHLWIFLDDENGQRFEFYDKSEDRSKCHAEVWGHTAWDNRLRGYYDKNRFVITCHDYAGVDPRFLKRLEKATEKNGLTAIYFRGEVRELCSV
jgi:hypothetical protein